MYENAFGYDERIPEIIRTELMWLCQDVASLHNKWAIYSDLFNNKENTDILSELAFWTFINIEESMRNDMTMAISRLCDSAKTCGKNNLSLAFLVENCPDIPDLSGKFEELFKTSDSVIIHRNKRVGHNDLNSVITPRENPLPGITKYQIDKIIKLAESILITVFLNYTKGELLFSTTGRGGPGSLLFYLKKGKSRANEFE